jgi:3-hexulose-6-phosphate synthase
MKLQLALDTVNVEEAIALMEKCQEWVDIIEIGTPMLIEYGLEAVRRVKEAFPEHLVLADAKIMDAGELEATMCFRAGADIVTVLGVSHPTTIANTVKAAKMHGKMMMVDMIDVERIAEKTKLIDEIGVDYICVHTAFDLQGEQSEPLAELKIVNQIIKNSKSAVAGGVKLSTVRGVVAYKPEVIVVGGGITNQENPAEVAQQIKEIMEEDNATT